MDYLALALAVAAIVVFLVSEPRWGFALLTAALIAQWTTITDQLLNL